MDLSCLVSEFSSSFLTSGSRARAIINASKHNKTVIIMYGICILDASTASSASSSAPLRVWIFALKASIPEKSTLLINKMPIIPAHLLNKPMIDIRFAADSIGPNMVTYGLTAVCKRASPVP